MAYLCHEKSEILGGDYWVASDDSEARRAPKGAVVLSPSQLVAMLRMPTDDARAEYRRLLARAQRSTQPRASLRPQKTR